MFACTYITGVRCQCVKKVITVTQSGARKRATVSTRIDGELSSLLDTLVREVTDEYGIPAFRSRSEATTHAIKDFLGKQSKNGTIDLESSFVVDPDNCTPITYVEKLGCGDHAMLLYRNEIVSRSISIFFLSSGLQRGAAGVYLASERRIDQVTCELRRRGIDTEEREKKGAFAVMSAEEWYLRRGKASADMIIGNWLKLAKDKIKEGYKVLQAVGETDCFFDNGEVKELMVYEKKLGKRFSLPMCALCVYDAARVEPKHFWSLMEAHGHGIFQGIAFKSV